MGNPYVYKIINKNNEFYFGVRWSYEGTPNTDLWKNYFTSSSLIKKIISKEGIDFFTPIIIKVFENKEDALKLEYDLIKENFNKQECLNRALGKCTIWDETLRKKVSESVKKLWKNEEYRLRGSMKSSGINNHNFKINPWRNVNSDIKSWKLVVEIYKDSIIEKWDFSVYGFGRAFLVKKYGIAQGTARSFIKLMKNNWNPLLDSDFLLFLNQDTRVS